MARIVLDARAVAHGLEHLEVVGGALRQALRFQDAVSRLELGHARLKLFRDGAQRLRDLGALRHIVRGRPDGNGVKLAHDLARHLVHLGNELDLVAKEADAQRVFCVGRKHVNGVTAHAEVATLDVVVVAVVLDVDQRMDEVVALKRLVLADGGRQTRVILGAADTIDAAHGCHHNDVAAAEQAGRGLMAQLLYLFVDGGILLDVGIRLGHIRLGLVVVVVADEVDHGVVGKQLAHLACDLRGQRLVGLHDEGGLLGCLDELCHGEGLARARHAQKRLVAQAVLYALGQLGDGLRLVSGRLVRRDHLKPGVILLPPKATELSSKVTDNRHALSLHVHFRTSVP